MNEKKGSWGKAIIYAIVGIWLGKVFAGFLFGLTSIMIPYPGVIGFFICGIWGYRRGANKVKRNFKLYSSLCKTI